MSFKRGERAAVLLAAGAAVMLAGCPADSPSSAIPVPVSVGPPAAASINAPAEQGAPAPGELGLVASPAMPAARQPIAPLMDEAGKTVHLAACRNEVLSFELSFSATRGKLQDLRTSVSDIAIRGPKPPGVVGRLDRQAVRIFRTFDVPVRDLPGWYQLHSNADNRAEGTFRDVLLPADHPRWGQPWTLDPGAKLTLWFDVAVAADASPGNYEGTITLTAAGHAPRQIAVRLEVLPVTLPDDPPLRFFAPVDFKRMLADELADDTELTDGLIYAGGQVARLAAKRMAQWMELTRAHGVQMLPADLGPYYRRDITGRLVVDWRGFDQLVGPFLAGKDAPPVWLAPLGLDQPSVATHGGVDSPAYGSLVEQYVREIGRHFLENKWPEPLVWLHREQPPPATLPYGAAHWRDWLTEQRAHESEAVGRLVALAEVRVGFLESLPWSAMSAEQPADAARQRKWFGSPVPPHVTCYCPPASMLDPAQVKPLAERRVSAWLGMGQPPWRPSAAVYAPPEQLLAFSYIARRSGIADVMLHPVTAWPGRSPLAEPLRAADTEFLFYPGHWFEQDQPVASVRLKQLRRARQDAAYLKLLADLGRSGTADGIAGLMVKYALADAASGVPGLGGAIGWLQSPELYDDARMVLRMEIGAAGEGPTSDAAAQMLRQRWMAFADRTAWVQVGLYPAQLIDQLDGSGALTGRMAAVCRVSACTDSAGVAALASQLRLGRPVVPTLSFDRLADGWRATRFNVPVQTSSPRPAEAALLTLLAEGRELPINKFGRVPMNMALGTSGSASAAKLGTSMPVLAAYPFRRPPTIDGELGDWPSGWLFRGVNFFRLTPAQSVEHMPDTTPPSDTWMVAGYDDKALYIAVVCLGQSLQSSRPTNVISFDDGVIIGEDAIEVVLDPTGGRLGRDELFHLVAKSNGATVGWRGMTGAGGMGSPQPWGRLVRLAIAPGEKSGGSGGWVAEFAIDRRELGPTNEHGLWRINVARHRADRGEHSAWASHQPDLSDPRTLGNLLLRPVPLPKVEVPLTPVSPLED